MVNNSETLKNLNGIKPDFFFHDFRVIHSAINEFSDSENGPAAYSLHQAGNEKYEDFINGISTSLSRQWARNMSSEDVSKDDRYVLRLATVLHVPYDQLPWLLILQDDHLTAETWTACECGAIDAKDSHNQSFLVSCPSSRWNLKKCRRLELQLVYLVNLTPMLVQHYIEITLFKNISKLFGFVSLANGILDDSENITMQPERYI